MVSGALLVLGACGDDDDTDVDTDMSMDEETPMAGSAGRGGGGGRGGSGGGAGRGGSGGGGGSADLELPDVDCMDDVPAFADVAAFDKCTMCHSSELTGADRNGAPADANWDDEDVAVDHAEEIANRVFEDLMPPPASGITLTQAEEDDLYLWALCEP